jgi:alkylhydroperoxidase family enzyme
MNKAKFNALDQYNTSPPFTDAERAVLDYVTELTKHKKVNPVFLVALLLLLGTLLLLLSV